MSHINIVGPDVFVTYTEVWTEVWQDPSDGDGDRFAGLLIGEGPTKEVAVRQALEENQRIGRYLEEILRQHLQGHP